MNVWVTVISWSFGKVDFSYNKIWELWKPSQWQCLQTKHAEQTDTVAFPVRTMPTADLLVSVFVLNLFRTATQLIQKHTECFTTPSGISLRSVGVHDYWKIVLHNGFQHNFKSTFTVKDFMGFAFASVIISKWHFLFVQHFSLDTAIKIIKTIQEY